MKRSQWNRLTTVEKAIAFWKDCRLILIILHTTDLTYHHATVQTGFGQSQLAGATGKRLVKLEQLYNA